MEEMVAKLSTLQNTDVCVLPAHGTLGDVWRDGLLKKGIRTTTLGFGERETAFGRLGDNPACKQGRSCQARKVLPNLAFFTLLL